MKSAYRKNLSEMGAPSFYTTLIFSYHFNIEAHTGKDDKNVLLFVKWISHDNIHTVDVVQNTMCFFYSVCVTFH